MSALRREEIDKLPVAERLRLLEDIWESIEADPDALPITDAQRAELDRRLAAHRANPQASEDVDTVLARLRKQD
jgi:putative addiction module component (TIGR02574 family)